MRPLLRISLLLLLFTLLACEGDTTVVVATGGGTRPPSGEPTGLLVAVDTGTIGAAFAPPAEPPPLPEPRQREEPAARTVTAAGALPSVPALGTAASGCMVSLLAVVGARSLRARRRPLHKEWS